MCPRGRRRAPHELGLGRAAAGLGESRPSPGSDLLHWLLLQVLRFPGQREHRLLAHSLEVVGPKGQGLGVHTPGGRTLDSGCHLLAFDPAKPRLWEAASCLGPPLTGLQRAPCPDAQPGSWLLGRPQETTPSSPLASSPEALSGPLWGWAPGCLSLGGSGGSVLLTRTWAEGEQAPEAGGLLPPAGAGSVSTH